MSITNKPLIKDTVANNELTLSVARHGLGLKRPRCQSPPDEVKPTTVTDLDFFHGAVSQRHESHDMNQKYNTIQYNIRLFNNDKYALRVVEIV